MGCFTTAALRRLAQPDTAIIGVDHSPALIEAARRLTTDEGLADNVTYQVAMPTTRPMAMPSSTSSPCTPSSATSTTPCRCWGRPGA